MVNRKPLETAVPEDVGVDSAGILSFLSAVSESGLNLNSMLLLRHGKIAFEAYWSPFGPDINHQLCSCSKSITSTAVGFAVSEGLFSLDSRIVDLLPEKLDGNVTEHERQFMCSSTRLSSKPHPYIAAMTVRHLLTMATAFSVWKDPVTDDWTREFLNAVPDHYPGTVFGYDTSGTHTLGEIVEKYSGSSMLDYLTPRLFDPIGIEGVEWEVSPMGVCRGGGGVRMTTRGMARFGLLYLGGGVFDGVQVLPEGWARQATSRQIDNSNSELILDGGKGYGYQFWRVRNGAYACLGIGGQVILILPEQDAVFVTTANTMDEEGGRYLAVELFWDHIFPALRHGVLPPGPAAADLAQAASGLQCPLPKGNRSNDIPRQYSGKRFRVEENAIGYDAFRLDYDDKQGKLILFKGGERDIVEFGMGEHLPGEIPFQKYISEFQTWGEFTLPHEKFPRLRSRCGSAAVWTDERTLVIRSHIVNAIQSFTITCHLGNEALVIQIKPFGVFAYDYLPCVLTHIL